MVKRKRTSREPGDAAHAIEREGAIWREAFRVNPDAMARLAECVIGLTILLVIGSTTAAIMLNRANRETTESLKQVTEAKRELEYEKQSTLRNLYEARKQQARCVVFGQSSPFAVAVGQPVQTDTARFD